MNHLKITSLHFTSLHFTPLHLTLHFSLPCTFGRFVTNLWYSVGDLNSTLLARRNCVRFKLCITDAFAEKRLGALETEGKGGSQHIHQQRHLRKYNSQLLVKLLHVSAPVPKHVGVLITVMICFIKCICWWMC